MSGIRLGVRWQVVACGVLALAAVSCGGLPAVPSQGGPHWRSLETEHFVLQTDQSEEIAKRTSQKLERLLNALLQFGFHAEGKLPIKLPVILLDDRSQFEFFVGEQYRGIFVPELMFEPLVVIARQTDSDSWSTLTHELVHFIADQALGPQPPWLSEGLATYFESAHFDKAGSFVIGSVPRDRHRWLRSHARLGVEALQMQNGPSDTPALYASAWLLVHYLMSERGSEFAAFQSALASGKPAAQAWQETMGDLTPERLDALLDNYAETGNFLNYSKQIAEPQVQTTVRELSDADVYTLRAELFLTCRACGDDRAQKVAENLQAALKSDPDHLRANALLQLGAANADGRSVERSRALTHKHPDAWLAWLLLARAETNPGSAADGCDADVVSHLQALAPRQPYALMAAALCELHAKRRESALDLSSQAIKLRPANGELLLLRAALLRAVGQCDELKAVLERVRNATHTAVAEAQIQELSQCTAPETTQ